MSKPDEIKLWCWVLGDPPGRVFSVSITRSATIQDLKRAIHGKKPAFEKITAHSIKLFQVEQSLKSFDEDCAQSFQLGDRRPLNPWEQVSFYWKEDPEKGVLSVILLRPAGISPSSSDKSNISAYVANIGSRRPSIHRNWCPRSDLIQQLFIILQRYRLIQVRGTPGSGKTTIKNLLHDYILKQNPSAVVIAHTSWNRCGDDLDTSLTRVDPAYPSPDAPTFLLFDEAQDTYDDVELWNNFFKNLHDNHKYYIVLFCSYGSPSSRPVTYEKGGTPLVLDPSARLSLWSTVENEFGLLLSRNEFEDVVDKFYRPLNLHPDLREHFFHLTAGHVGAVEALLEQVSYQKCAETQKGYQFTLDDFYAENPIHSLVKSIQNRGFERGLPRSTDLAENPEVASFLRTLIRDGQIEGNKAKAAVVDYCHRHGWIYSDEKEGVIFYTFPSPLHSAFVSWILKSSDNAPPYALVREFCIDVVKRFKPSQMFIPIRRVGQRNTITSVPEAQYQDEFYRSVFSLTAGNVCISPEFASAKGSLVYGRIDFFIPKMRWGIEITRNGDRLLEHYARFEESGAYGAWMQSNDMTDYVLLDCRTSVPRKHHPNMEKLLHAVFDSNYEKVTFYDNNLQQVGNVIGLVENHY